MFKNYFPNFIGQEKLKNKLSFLIDAHKKTRIFDSAMLVSKRGDGKSQIAKLIGNNLLGANSKPKKFLEINSASVKTVTSFVDNIVVPHIRGNQEVTIFLDEFGKIHSEVEDWLLSVLCPNEENKTFAYHDGVRYDFDFKYCSFLMATTDAHAISLPMKSRLRRLEFEPYTNIDLMKILHRYSPNISYRDLIERKIVNILRDSPRATVMLSKDIIQFTKNANIDYFGENEWEEFKQVFGILPLGLTSSELQLLRFLREGNCTLTTLAAKFSLDTSELRKEIELFPLSKGLIQIDGKRKITTKGLDLIKSIDGV